MWGKGGRGEVSGGEGKSSHGSQGSGLVGAGGWKYQR